MIVWSEQLEVIFFKSLLFVHYDLSYFIIERLIGIHFTRISAYFSKVLRHEFIQLRCVLLYFAFYHQISRVVLSVIFDRYFLELPRSRYEV